MAKIFTFNSTNVINYTMCIFFCFTRLLCLVLSRVWLSLQCTWWLDLKQLFKCMAQCMINGCNCVTLGVKRCNEREYFSWTITRRQVSIDLWLIRPSPVKSTLSVLSTKTFFRTGNELSQQCRTKWSWNAPQSMVRFMTRRGPYQLQIGTYQEHCQQLKNKGICHLPLQRLNPMLL